MADSKMTPMVTVVIPMFNACPFIGEMLECIEKQTYTNWELIVVDDGSTDESVATVQSYAVNDDRIKLIKRPDDRNKGGNTCRNIGFENARGKYIIWFDADDLIAPFCFEQRVNFIQNHSEIDFAIFPLLSFSRKPYDRYDHSYGFYWGEDVICKFISNFPPFVIVSNIYNLDTLKSKGIKWDEQLRSHQDVDMNLECISKKLKYMHDTRALPDYFWRLEGNHESVSKKIYSASHLQTNIYYFNKQVARYEHDIKYRTSLHLLANYVFKVLLFQSDKTFVDHFLENNYFTKHKWLKYRFHIINRFQHHFKFNSHIPANLSTLLFMPMIELKYRLEARKWLQSQRKFAQSFRTKR